MDLYYLDYIESIGVGLGTRVGIILYYYIIDVVLILSYYIIVLLVFLIMISIGSIIGIWYIS